MANNTDTRPDPEMELRSRLKDLQVKKIALTSRAYEKGPNPKTGKMDYYDPGSHSDQKSIEANKKRILHTVNAEIKMIEHQLKQYK